MFFDAAMLDAGDVAWVELDPVLGTEQAGRRPALVLSTRSYHEVSARAVVCPITSQARPWPFNVIIPQHLAVDGVILVDQIRTLHRPSRIFDVIGRLPDEVVGEVRDVLAALTGMSG